MPTFSANLGFLWTDLALPDAVRAASKAGFHAVECHEPYNIAPDALLAALAETRLEMLSLNTTRGDVAAGEFGLTAVPGRQAEAHAAIDAAMKYAAAIGTRRVHVLAGLAGGEEARDTYVQGLGYACRRAAALGITVLIEPLNAGDVPGYFLNTLAQAADIIADVAADNLKLMFDCYHVGMTEGDIEAQLRRHLPLIGHIQFAGVPGRGAPDRGDVDYAHLFRVIDGLGWSAPLGAEYRPDGASGASLDWMGSL